MTAPRIRSSTRRIAPRLLAIAPLVGVGLMSSSAHAHIELLTPAARYTPNHQKTDPCGHPDNPAAEEPPTTYQAGQTITVRFEEFVQHTGHFRIALDTTGTDTFTSPTNFDDFYNSPQVLLDEIVDDQDGGLHEVDVTLPDTLCNPCTLQLIQVMTDDGAWGPGNDDLYFQCADIVIEPATADGGSGDPPEGESGANDGPSAGTMDGSSGRAEEPSDSGCACALASRSDNTTTSSWLVLVLLGLRRRRT